MADKVLRFLGAFAWMDEATGELLIENAETGEKKSTGYMLEIVPVYPWPMSLVWNQNAGQFATLKATGRVRDKMRSESALMRALEKAGWTFRAVQADPVRVGPFTWGRAGMIEARHKGRYEGRYNAGLAIQAAVRESAAHAFRVVWADITRQVQQAAKEAAKEAA